MQVELRIKIKSNPNLYRYLRENSHWYKYLNRTPLALSKMEEEMKERYKLRTVDRLENVSNTINLVQSFLKIMN